MFKKLKTVALGVMVASSACSHPSTATNATTETGSPTANVADQPHPVATPQTVAITATVPAGWKAHWSADGDLNGDGVADYVMVLKQDDNGPRRLLISFGKPDGSRTVAADTETFLPKVEDGNDPIADDNPLEVKNRTLRIVVPGTGVDLTNETYVFRYQNGQFELIGYDAHNQEKGSGDYDDESVNYSTGVIEHRVGNISRDKAVVTRGKVPQGPKPTLASINLTNGFTPPSVGS